MLRRPRVRAAARACTANGPELKSLASGRLRLGGELGRVSEVGHVHFSSAARNSGDNDASLIHAAAPGRRNNACRARAGSHYR